MALRLVGVSWDDALCGESKQNLFLMLVSTRGLALSSWRSSSMVFLGFRFDGDVNKREDGLVVRESEVGSGSGLGTPTVLPDQVLDEKSSFL